MFVSEFMNPPYDEGIKKTAKNIFDILSENYDVLTICRYGNNRMNNQIITRTNPLFINISLKRMISAFNPDILIYLPFSSSTLAGYLRMRILSWYCTNAKKIFIALQPKLITRLGELFIKLFKPQIALTPSPELLKQWEKLQIKAFQIPLFINIRTFSVNRNYSYRMSLRNKYNIPQDSFVIIHFGHLNTGRNLDSLMPLQGINNQVVIIGSSSTPKDAIGPKYIKEKLVNNGIIIIDQFIENIEEIYQLSDLYVFPVINNTGSIGLPLSILEARSCGIPVLTTDYGSIKIFLGDDYKSIFYSLPKDFYTIVEKIKKKQGNYHKTKVLELNNKFLEVLNNLL